MKRAEVVLKSMKRDIQETTSKQQKLQQQLKQEKELLETELRSIEEEETKLIEEERRIDREIISLQNRISKRAEAKKRLEQPRSLQKPTLQNLEITTDQLLLLVPFLDALIAGVRGSQFEIERFLHQRIPSFSHRFLKEFITVVTRKTERSMFNLVDELWDKEKDCVRLDDTLPVTDEIQKKCEELGEYARVNGRQVLDVKQWFQDQENYMANIRNQLVRYVIVHYPVQTEQITSKEALAEMHLSVGEVWSYVYSVLCIVEEVGVVVDMKCRMVSGCGDQSNL